MAARLLVAAMVLAPACARAAAPIGDRKDKTTVGEVIVTAQRRQETLQSVPIAITVYTSQQRDLRGIDTVQDMAKFTPGMQYSTLLDRTYIRGVGRDISNLFTQPGVATYLDDVYSSSIASASSDSLFLDRLEVLRGPQGTLYGRNTIGGAINAISRRPTDSLYAEVRTTIGNYGVYNVEGAVSGPIADGVRFRLAGYRNDQEQGYFKDVSGLKSEGGNGVTSLVEAQLDAKLGPNVDVWLKATTYAFDTTLGPAASPSPYDRSPFLPGTVSPNPAFGYTQPGLTEIGSATENPGVTDLRAFSHNTPSRGHLTGHYLGTAEIVWHTPWAADLKYIGGVTRYGYHSDKDEGTSVTSYLFPSEPSPVCAPDPQCPPLAVFPTVVIGETQRDFNYSNELDLKSTGDGPVQWIVGLFQYHEQASNDETVKLPFQPQLAAPLGAPPDPLLNIYTDGASTTSDSYAGFGQVDWRITPRFKLTGGLRYTYDSQRGVERVRLLCFGLPGCAPASLFGAYTPAVDITQYSISYALDPGVVGPPTLDPETGFFSRRLSASWSATTGTVGAAWTPDATSLVYAKYSRGYKAGGFNAASISAFPETQPEYLDAYEVGAKHQFGRTLQIDAELFFYNYGDMQIPLPVRVLGAPDITKIINLGHVQSYGFEVEGTWTPMENLQFRLSYSYLNAKVRASKDCFVDSVDPFALQPEAKTAGCPADGSQNVEGQTTPQSPPNRVVAEGDYTLRFAPGDLTFDAAFVWTDKTYDQIFNRPYSLAPAFDTVDMRLIWNDARGRFTAIAFGKNILNALGYDDAEGGLGGDGRIARYFGLTPPATYGLELQYRFR